MKAVRTPRLALQVLLISLWLIGQGVALLHTTNLDAHAHDGSCDICLQSHALGHAGVDTGIRVSRPQATEHFFITGSPNILVPVTTAHPARAPPIIL